MDSGDSYCLKDNHHQDRVMLAAKSYKASYLFHSATTAKL